MTDTMTIGQLAGQAGVNVQTVRYYERRGLLTPVARRESGYREFLPIDVRRIRFIKNAQRLGFTLQEITDLLQLRIADEEACESVRDRAESKIKEISVKLSELRRMKKTLETLVLACEDRRMTDECPILDALIKEE